MHTMPTLALQRSGYTVHFGPLGPVLTPSSYVFMAKCRVDTPI